MKKRHISQNELDKAGRWEDILELLNKHGMEYHVVQHPPLQSLQEAADYCGINHSKVVRPITLSTKRGLVMALLPGNHLLDFSGLYGMLGSDIQMLENLDLQAKFKLADHGRMVPIPSFYNIKAIIDENIFLEDPVYFDDGSHRMFVEVSQEDFKQLVGEVQVGIFSVPERALTNNARDLAAHDTLGNVIDRFAPQRAKKRVDDTLDLPAFPSIASELLQLRGNPEASIEDLVHVIEKDPSLTAQVVSWACSPYYGFRGKVESVHDAIVKVLGYELVLNLSIGIAISEVMRVPIDGPLGLKSYWRHALMASNLCEEIFRILPYNKRPNKGLLYLSGMLHNFGHLLLGQVFPPQFFLLNRFLALNPDVAIMQIEKSTLGFDHTEIAGWLMENWHMPKEIVISCQKHHDENYDGEMSVYPNIVLVVNRLLQRISVGDEQHGVLPVEILSKYDLTVEQCEEVLEHLIEHRVAIEEIVETLS